MKSHYRAVVIGGGIVGCSVLYHLTKLGWPEVVLCERKELTAGSTWHAAGGFHAINSQPAISKLQAYTIALYEEIERLSGQAIGLHFTGGLNVAATSERWEFLRADWPRHRVLGLNTELVSPAEIQNLCPLMDTRDVLGAIFDPKEGHLDPYGATHAFAKAARQNGADVLRQTRVLALTPTGRGSWTVQTDKGSFEAEHVINAAGLWAREVGALVGVRLPVIPVEHHYLLTEDLEELKAADRELPLIIDLDGEIYLRQERKGVLLGVYEKNATPWALNGAPWDYGQDELLNPDLERISEALNKGFERFPRLADAGIRRVINGPFTCSPDGNPLVGPVHGVPNYWSACGVMAAFSQAGGVGLALAQWMTRGETEDDLFAMDVARFGDFATENYTVEKAKEFYGRRFQIAYPNEHWPAGRPAKTSPLYEALKENGAVFGASFGSEVPLYISAGQETAIETPSLRRSNAFACVAQECRAARQAAALMDFSSFGKYEVSGPRAAASLDHLLAASLPEVGRVRLTPMLSESGRLMGDFTTARLEENKFLVFGSGYLQNWHMRWFDQHLAGEGVTVRNRSEELSGVAILGPQSRTLLQRLTRVDLSNAACPFLAARQINVRLTPAILVRVSVSGELGYELYARASYFPSLYRALHGAGEDLGLRDIGLYAIDSLRLEKGVGIWSREFSTDYTPRMCGLDRYVNYKKTAFVGRDAALRDRHAEPARRMVLLEVDAVDADAAGYEPIWQGSACVGYVTSGGYGHCAQKSLAMGYLNGSAAAASVPLQVSITGQRRDCRMLKEVVIDPAGHRLRS